MWQVGSTRSAVQALIPTLCSQSPQELELEKLQDPDPGIHDSL